MKTSLVIPAYNEEKRLEPFLQSVVSYALRHPHDIQEIIVVDDGSTDTTSAVAHRWQRQLPSLKIISLPHNQGKGAAVQTGIMAAKGDYVVFIDADGATDISELPKMTRALTVGDIAIGNRWMRGAKTERNSLLRKFSGWIYRTYMRAFGLGAIDTMCGFKGYRTSAAKLLFRNLQEKRWLFDTEIAYKAVRGNFHIINFPIHWQSKDGSKLKTSTLIKSAFAIWPLIRRIKRETI